MPTQAPDKTKTEERPNPELDKAVSEDSPLAKFVGTSLGIAVKPKDEKKAKAEKPEGDDTELEEDTEREDEDRPKKKKKAAPVVQPPSIDEEKLGASIAAGLAPHLKQSKADDKKPDPDEITDPKEKRRVEILFHMEQMPEFSERYKGLAERYKDVNKKAREYKAKWVAENPGQEFDEEADEHRETLDALDAQIAYDDEDYQEALADIRADKRFAEKKGELDSRLSEVERTEKARGEAPKIQSVAADAGNTVWKDLGDDFKDVVTEEGGINLEALKAIEDSDPIKHEIAMAAATTAEAAAAEIYKLANGLAAYNPKNPIHANLGSFAVQKEQEMTARPAEDQLDDHGRSFVTKEQYGKLTEKQRAKHWTFSSDDLIFLHNRAIAKKAKLDLAMEEEKFKRRAKARGLLKDDDSQGAEKAGRREVEREDEGEPDDSPVSHSRKPISPSSATTPKSAAKKNGAGSGNQSGWERFAAKSIG